MSANNTKAKLARIQRMGGRVTTVAEFLGLSREDQAYVEMRLALSQKVRETRQEMGWNQSQLAERVGSEQSRIAKVEKADPSVSFDLLIRSLLALQLGPQDIASALMTIGAARGNGKSKVAVSKKKKARRSKAVSKKPTRRR